MSYSLIATQTGFRPLLEWAKTHDQQQSSSSSSSSSTGSTTAATSSTPVPIVTLSITIRTMLQVNISLFFPHLPSNVPFIHHINLTLTLPHPLSPSLIITPRNDVVVTCNFSGWKKIPNSSTMSHLSLPFPL